MSCLQDIYCGKRVIIGIKDFNLCENPESGLFINALPGISLKAAASIVNEEYHTAQNFLFEKIKIATKLVVQDFTNTISDNFDFNSIIANREIHYFKPTELLPKINVDRGIVLKRWRSELANIYIENIYVQSADSGIAIIKIIDGAIIKQYEVSLIANAKMVFEVNYRAKSEEVKILINDTNFQMYSGSMNNVSTGCGSCSGASQDLYVVGWDGTEEQSTYYGVGVSASVRCYEDNAICKLMERLYFPIWYRAGIEVCMEKIHGNRINNIVTFDSGKAKELMEYFWKEYNKTKKDFAVNSKTFLRSLTADCVTCNSMRHVQSLPS